MDELIALLKSDPSTAIQKLTSQKKDKSDLDTLREEFQELDRNIRTTQVGKIQKDKTIGEGNNSKSVKKVKIPVPFQNKIVQTATAFEVGEAPTLIPDTKTKLSDEIIRLWKVLRLESVLQKIKILQKSELQCAVSFYVKVTPSSNRVYRTFGLNKKREIKSRIFQNKNGEMSPYFDGLGDMKFFTWEFSVKNSDNKEIKQVWVWDEVNVHILKEDAGGFSSLQTKPHGFDRIPVVYLNQEKPEWFIAQEMIDRLEVSISRLGDSNDYTGHPILKIYGEVEGAPEKDEEGKAFVIPMEENEETGKIEHGDVKFLTYDQAPESVKLEMDRLEKYIYSLTSTPDISFENLKGIGAISGIAIKLMFLDAIVKAKMNEGENRTIIERINNILIGGTVKTVATSLSSEIEKTFLNVQFNSILPDDIKDSVETYARAVEAKIMSQKVAIEKLNATDNYQEELQQILDEQELVETIPPVTTPSE